MRHKRHVDMLVVHCAASKGDVSADTIRQWHLDRGWRDIGYHEVIRTSGLIEIGRDIDEIGAHAAGYNANSIGICLSGGFSGDVSDFTEEQLQSLRDRIDHWTGVYGSLQVVGHNDLTTKKTCPNFDVRHWLLTDELI